MILELHRILGAYWDNIVLVGGWIPTLLANNENDPHLGTADVDLALNHLLIPNEAYGKIHALLTGHNYRQNTDKAKQFQYFRTINIEGIDRVVVLDLLTGQYNIERGKSRRHEPVQDVMALKARGVDLVFTRYEVVTIEGDLPDKGGHDSVNLKVAGAAPIIVMKCAAIFSRLKDKDSYDLYYFIKNYKGGATAVLEAIKPDIHHGLMTEALQKLRRHFKTMHASGPAQVARFLELADDVELATRQRDVFEVMNDFLSRAETLADETPRR